MPMPSARNDAIADASVQPVPWVWRLAMRGPGNRVTSEPSNSRSTGLPGRCPPLTRIQRGPSELSDSAARRMPVSSVIRLPVSNSASSRLGVSTVASGSKCAFTASRVPADSRLSPCFETATGSTTTGAGTPASLADTVSTIAADASIPVLTACTGMSPRTESSWARTESAGTSQYPWTPTEFCAVTAQTTLIPCTPRASIVFRSAWMPAPPAESEPAIASTHGGVGGMLPRVGSGSAETARGSVEPALRRLPRCPVGDNHDPDDLSRRPAPRPRDRRRDAAVAAGYPFRSGDGIDFRTRVPEGQPPVPEGRLAADRDQPGEAGWPALHGLVLHLGRRGGVRRLRVPCTHRGARAFRRRGPRLSGRHGPRHRRPASVLELHARVPGRQAAPLLARRAASAGWRLAFRP